MTAAPLNNSYAKRLQQKYADARLREAAPDLFKAGKNLAIETGGILRCFELELRQVMGNTNYQVLLDKLTAFNAAITKAEEAS